VEDIKSVLSNLRRWTINHIKREANSVAHELAKEATRKDMDHVWIEEVPSCIVETVILERMALSL
jgi:hypothetical protein